MPQPTGGRRRFRADIGRTRRLLNRLPDAVQKEVVQMYGEVGPQIRSVGRALAPRRTGRLADALAFRVLPKTMRFEFGLIGRRLQRSLFYGYILEVGRKAKTSRVFQRRLKNGGLSKRYTIQVSPIAYNRYDFVFGRVRTYARQLIAPKLKTLFTKALRAVSEGNNG